MMFCHILYINHHINLIINKETHPLLIAGNKIVTKNEEIRLVVGFMYKVTKDNHLPKKK